ncbi:MAG: hypothetical protein Q4D04_15515 [Clostridia bacterium]|nr:hypothetical protein [Clostridia bacterium]
MANSGYITADEGIRVSACAGEVAEEERIFVTADGCAGTRKIAVIAPGFEKIIPVVCTEHDDGYLYIPATRYARKSEGWSVVAGLGRGVGDTMEACRDAGTLHPSI